jgi:hypothetical protein
MTSICPECGQEVQIGEWPYCPHGSIYERNAQRWDPIVVWQSNSDGEKFSFPGQANEPCPEGYHRVEITDMRQADRFVSRMNAIERQKMEEARELRHTLDDAGVKDRRGEEDARGWAMRADGTKFYIRGNGRAEALQRRVREWADQLRERRRSQHARLDPNFHIQVLSFDSGNRSSYSGQETGWRERKK